MRRFLALAGLLASILSINMAFGQGGVEDSSDDADALIRRSCKTRSTKDGAVEFMPDATCKRACNNNSGDVSNASRRMCAWAFRTEESKNIAQKACNTNSCIYKISCTKSGCSGSGYIVAYTEADAGYNVVIKDPRGIITKFFQCGTCNFLDYESGPMKNATLTPIKAGYILKIPNR